jgi:prepilin-type N-terminal cleavage/methylation domain-containing protein
VFSVSSVVKSSAFSLVELLVVMAIIGMMVGLSALAVSGMRAPAVQHAADQVMSGLSLARQIAITKNTQAALLIANQTNAGFPTNGPYRHWSVVYSNRGANTWTFAKDWEELPNGTVFSELLTISGASKYNSLTINPFNISAGQTLPAINLSPGNSTTNFSISSGNNTTTINNTPCIRFSSAGAATNGAIAVRISSGSASGGNATITSTNQYFFIETDTKTGRIRMRAPESYK